MFGTILNNICQKKNKNKWFILVKNKKLFSGNKIPGTSLQAKQYEEICLSDTGPMEPMLQIHWTNITTLSTTKFSKLVTPWPPNVKLYNYRVIQPHSDTWLNSSRYDIRYFGNIKFKCNFKERLSNLVLWGLTPWKFFLNNLIISKEVNNFVQRCYRASDQVSQPSFY